MKVWLARYGWFDEGWVIGVYETQLKSLIGCLKDWKKECLKWSKLRNNRKRAIKYLKRYYIEKWEVE